VTAGDDLFELLSGDVLVLLGRDAVGEIVQLFDDLLELTRVEPDPVVGNANVDLDVGLWVHEYGHRLTAYRARSLPALSTPFGARKDVKVDPPDPAVTIILGAFELVVLEPDALALVAVVNGYIGQRRLDQLNSTIRTSHGLSPSPQ
jgi:hypothetical protein